jgi:putative copper export protein
MADAAMSELYLTMLIVHLLGASIWTGGHLILAMIYLPTVLKRRDVALLLSFEQRLERIGMPALAAQIVTGLWLAGHLIGWEAAAWLDAGSPMTRAIWIKLALLAATAGLAVNARFRVLPRLTPERLPVMAAHLIAVTALSLGFVVAGVLAGRGGL